MTEPPVSPHGDTPPRAAPPPPAPRRGKPWILAGAGALGLAAAAALALMLLAGGDKEPGPGDGAAGTAAAPPAPDPRVTYAGPFKNVHPTVGYTGDAACAKCHDTIAAAYRTHPMARSLAPVAAVVGSQPFDLKHNNPFEALGSRFVVERKEDRLLQRQTRLDGDGKAVYERTTEAHYAVGSGSRGYSYLTVKDDYLFQAPVSWFGQKEIWDLSPGFKHRHVASRPVTAECMFCHANHALHRPGTVNRYDPPVFHGLGIGCERCHGPGELHAKSEAPLEIVNPAKLAPALRDAVCEQCHLEGAARVVRRGREPHDFRPGLPLDAALAVFVRGRSADGGRKAVNHVEQMHLSKCYAESKGDAKLGCVSCHDPHKVVTGARRAEWYRARCLKCHKVTNCDEKEAVRLAKADSCFECHMPRYASTDIAHTAATDHRVVERPDPSPAGADSPLGAVVPFGRPADPSDPEQARDLGVALVMLMAQSKLDPVLHSGRAVALLEAATARDPGDSEAWAALGTALLARGEEPKALTAFQSGLARAPAREDLLAGAGMVALRLDEGDLALDYCKRAVDANPWMPEYRANLVAALARKGRWVEVRTHAEAWLRLEPESAHARMALIDCLLRAGEAEAARAEFALVERLRPPELEQMRKWFADRAR